MIVTLLTHSKSRENVMIALLGLVKMPRSRNEALIEALVEAPRKTLVLDHVRGLLITNCY